MPAKEYNEVKMRGILPSDGMDAIPVTEGSPITEIDSRMWVWDSVGGDWVKSKGNAAGELTVNFATPIGVTESAPLTSIQVEPKPNADSIPVGKIPDGGVQISNSKVATNATTILRTVTAGKVLYISAVTLSVTEIAIAPANGFIEVRNAGDVVQYSIMSSTLFAIGTTAQSVSFPTLLEIPEGWDIVVRSDNANLVATAFLHAYER